MSRRDKLYLGTEAVTKLGITTAAVVGVITGPPWVGVVANIAVLALAARGAMWAAWYAPKHDEARR